jgi:hypothetical protein
MARDLIPPPSPAGRPAPDGTPNLIELPPEPTPLDAEPAAPSPPPGPSQFRNRFGFLLGALAGVFIAVALVAAIVVANRGGRSDDDFGLASNWSRWQPSDTTIEGGSQQIADKVASEYKHPDGKQLVQIKAAVLPDEYELTVHSSTITDIQGNRLLYTFDGLGPNRTIDGGTPSATRLKVIYREALELSLYTFRYLPDVESITLLLPPPPKSDEETKAAALAAASGTPPEPLPALFYRPGDLKPQLQVPLGQTVGAKAPSTDKYTGAEATAVDTLTLSNRFEFQQTGNYKFVLNRPS